MTNVNRHFLSCPEFSKNAKIWKSAPGDVIRASTLFRANICVFEDLFKQPTSNVHNSAKSEYFLMRFFLFASYDGGLSIYRKKIGVNLGAEFPFNPKKNWAVIFLSHSPAP